MPLQRSLCAMDEREFITLRKAARRLGVPMTFLESEAKAGRVPFLRAGRRMLFDVDSAHAALVDRARRREAVAT